MNKYEAEMNSEHDLMRDKLDKELANVLTLQYKLRVQESMIERRTENQRILSILRLKRLMTPTQQELYDELLDE